MPDPISLIALGAAVGGAAGKFTEKAWDAGSRWLSAFFSGHAEQAQRAAQENAAAFLLELAQRVKVLEKSSSVSQETIAAAQDHPQFSVVLQRALISAAQTDDPRKRATLAFLVAQRLANPQETTVAFASKLACDAVSDITADQLEYLGLGVFIEEIRPKVFIEPAAYQRWLEVWLSPFEDIAFEDIDMMHLTALGCVTFDPTSERSLSMALSMKNNLQFDEQRFADSAVGSWLQINWDLGLAGMKLTSVGSIIGGSVLEHKLGRDVGQPSWAKRAP